MLRSAKSLHGYTIEAIDGAIGKVAWQKGTVFPMVDYRGDLGHLASAAENGF